MGERARGVGTGRKGMRAEGNEGEWDGRGVHLKGEREKGEDERIEETGNESGEGGTWRREKRGI